MACHARLPAEDQDRLSGVLFARVDEQSLSPVARAELLVATRKFDAALDSYERQLVDPFNPGMLLEMSEVIPDYLILTLRVRRDPDRARRGLAMLAQRRDLSPALQQKLELWQDMLVELGPSLQQPPSLDAARACT